MKQYGDITKLNGADLEPVDLIVGGSPCQDLSVAGLRKGLEGERSGLFMEMIRLIKEMRKKTNGLYPRFSIWENVCGAFSSNDGRDFSAVLTEFVRVVEPDAPDVPVPQEGWPKSGVLLGADWSLGWRTHDAQFWGVPQRRRRISLIICFRGQSAPEILFEYKSVSGNFEQSGETWESTSAEAEGSTGTAGECFGIDHVLLSGGTTFEGRGYYDDMSGCLKTQPHGVYQEKSTCLNPWDYQLQRIQPEDGIADTLCSAEKRSRTDSLVLDEGVYAVNENGDSNVSLNKDACPSLTTGGGKPGQSYPCVLTFQERMGKPGGGKGILIQEDHAGTIGTANHQMVLDENETAYCIQGNCIDRSDNAGCNGKGWTEDVSYTLNTIDRPAVYDPSVHHGYQEFKDVSETVKARYGTGGNNQPLVVEDNHMIVLNDHGGEQMDISIDKTGTIMAQMGGHQPLIMDEATTIFGDDVTPTVIRRCETATGNTQDGLIICQNIEEPNVYQAASFGNYSEGTGSLRASGGDLGGGSENLVCTPVVRRLTPLECERLQGFPDQWTNIPGASDAKRYCALGNSIALPFWEHLARRCVQYGDVKTIGSLFDGISGFPLVFKRAGARALWSSEIEPFCHKVVEYHMAELE